MSWWGLVQARLIRDMVALVQAGVNILEVAMSVCFGSAVPSVAPSTPSRAAPRSSTATGWPPDESAMV
ncbi:hypothetical protein ACQP2U_28720 [Nocardia sp. CA-084685]|uniref:hypothetical protein n=1 Tax=Nocardia sp. CA-084685 TaxID=3239970 RepID=UPI003D977F6D